MGGGGGRGRGRRESRKGRGMRRRNVSRKEEGGMREEGMRKEENRGLLKSCSLLTHDLASLDLGNLSNCRPHGSSCPIHHQGLSLLGATHFQGTKVGGSTGWEETGLSDGV